GSNGRARMGMAEVTMTLDNSDNRLPIAFAEVVIARRAYRSGENEYFLNGQRVRLRDIQDLLDRSGLGRRTHLVIGQGLIDQALALRPEDRRELFEEAAGITLYRHKRRQTLERLEQTAANLSRVRDIIAEITPRLRQLERQAERARHYEETAAQLRALLLVWYGHTWHLGLSRLSDAHAAARHWQETIGRTEAQIEAQQAALVSLRERQTVLRRQLYEWRRQLEREQSEHTAL
ncbi:MAG: chromosome segregation protein SMC, partial [Candidatus Thermofonsia Clade 3 bacterium]